MYFGKNHYRQVKLRVIFILRYSLLVDDKDKQEKKRPSSASRTLSKSTMKTFYYGGSPSSNMKNFTGCISFAYINRYDTNTQCYIITFKA